MQTPCSKGNDEAAHKKSGRTLCSRQSPVIVLQQRHPPELQDSVLLAAGGVVGGNVHHPALTPDEVIALPMDVQRFPHWLPCRRAHLPVGDEVQMMLPVHSLMVAQRLCCALRVLCISDKLLDNLTVGFQIHLELSSRF